VKLVRPRLRTITGGQQALRDARDLHAEDHFDANLRIRLHLDAVSGINDGLAERLGFVVVLSPFSALAPT
jgi:hypothetical protein